MKSIFFLITLVICNKSFSGILFQDLTIEKAIEKAKIENKKVFVDFYSTQCPPCAYMEKNVFSDQQLGDLVNAEYIAVRSNAGNIEGKIEKAKYNVSFYPTILIIDPDQGEIGRILGKKEVEELIKILSEIKEGTYQDKSQVPVKKEMREENILDVKRD